MECFRLTRGGIGMQSETTTAITAVKQDVRLREWAEQLEAQQASGLTVPQWCAENGIKTKSFYYRLRRVREQYIQSAHAVVPLSVPQQQIADIQIEKNALHISLPTSITKDTLLALVKCTAGQQPGRERDPTVCDRSQELAFQQYSERSKSKRSAVFDRCHSSGKRCGYRAVSDGTVLAACRDDSLAI